jgi:Uma2 family endonuclease
MGLRKRDTVRQLFYPESDGQPMAETELHCQLMINLIEALKSYFANQPDVYVWGNLFIYYDEDDPRKKVAPDVFVVRGVGKRLGERARRVYKLWEEDVAPCVVIEVLSSDTKNEDLHRKKKLYAQLGVKEYFIFDPEYSYLKPPFRAYRLSGSQYVESVITNRRVRSEELGLDLVNTGETLRLYDPVSEEFLLTPEEEAAARRQAEAELKNLRDEFARLKRKPAKKRPK